MKAVASRTNIILVGHWNRMIFTPAWVSKNLFEPKEILVPLLPIDPIRFDGGSFQVEVSFPRLALTVKTPEDEPLKRIEELAVTILDRLKDTPLKGVGVNFGFDAEADGFPHCDIFLGTDLKNTTLPILAKGATRQLDWGGGRQLNLTIVNRQKTIFIDLNFHLPVGEPIEAAKALSGNILDLYKKSQSFMRETYGLELERTA